FLGTLPDHGGDLPSAIASQSSFGAPTLGQQLPLLHLDDDANSARKGELLTSNMENTVLFSAHLLEHQDHGLPPQYRLLGSFSCREEASPADPRLFLNSNIPFS